MKIIDSHLHYYMENEHFKSLARASGCENTPEALAQTCKNLDIVSAVVMGNAELDQFHIYPDYLHYCVGINLRYMEQKNPDFCIRMVEKHLQEPQCVGIKLYPGYTPLYVSDPIYTPCYRLAAKYHKPVAIHTGDTATGNALIKYSHPLTVDDVAVAHPDVTFVLCHIGNPWIVDAIEIATKNDNVAIDLSGLLEGSFDTADLIEEHRDWLNYIRMWLKYLNRWDRIMYGTDWPLVNMQNYIDIVKYIVPEQHWNNVFYENAKNIYHMDV